MTKSVRVENADTSSYKVIVEVWQKSSDPDVPDTLESSYELGHPTAMGTYGIHSHKYLVIKES